MLPPRLKELAAASASAVDRAVAFTARLGLGAFVWPVIIGIGIGIGGLGLVADGFAHGLMKRKANLTFLASGLRSIAVGIAFTLVLAVVLAVLRRRRDTSVTFGEAYSTSLKCIAFLAAAPLVVALGEGIEASHGTLALAFAFITATLAAYSAYHFATDTEGAEGTRLSKLPWGGIVVGLATCVYAAWVCWIALQNHLAFNTARSDLGYYMSTFRQTSQGILLGCSLCGSGTHLTGHFDPIIILLAPFYLLYPFADTLLVLQAVWLASGAIPVYLYARRELGHRGAAAALAVAYLAYPALHGVNLFDFHSIALCIPLFVWLLYFLETGWALGYFVSLALVLLVREDMSLAVVCVSVYAMFRGGRYARFGWITLVSAVVYFVVAKAALMGRMDPLNNSSTGKGGYAYYYDELIPTGGATSSLVGILLTDPAFVLGKVLTEAKLDYVAKLLVPLFALPLFARGRILLGYGAALTLLASRPFLHSVHFQYSSPIIPFLFVLTAATLGRIRRGELGLVGLSGVRLSRALATGIVVCTVLCSWKFGGLVPNRTFLGGFRPLKRSATPDQLEVDAWLRKVSKSFPKGAKVAASSRVLTHLGPITNIYMLEDRRQADYVIAGSEQRPDGRSMSEEQALGNLHPMQNLRSMTVYRATWKDAAPAQKKPETSGDPERADDAEGPSP